MNTGEIRFTRGVPPVEVLPVEELTKITNEVLDESSAEVFQYAPLGRNLGNSALRSEIASGHGVDPGCVFVSNGSLQVLDLVSRHLIGRHSTTVYVEAPTYDRACKIFERHGGKVTGVPLQSDGPDIEALRALVTNEVPAFLYTIPDFQNPSGVCMSEQKRRELVALAEEYGFVILEDTPYRRLRYGGPQLPALAEISRERVVTLGSLSKVLSPGLRVGYAVADSSLVLELAELAEGTYLTASPFAQAIAAKCFEQGLVETSIARTVEFLKPRHDAAVAAAADAFGAGLLCVPGGGYFLSVLVNSALTEDELQAGARAAGVQLARGSAFYPAERPPAGTLFMRLPFQALEPEEFAAGTHRLADVLAAGHR